MSQAAVKEKKAVDRYKAVEDAYRSPGKKLGKEYFVVDCDRHIIEPPEAFTKYLDKEWQHMAPKPITAVTPEPAAPAKVELPEPLCPQGLVPVNPSDYTFPVEPGQSPLDDGIKKMTEKEGCTTTLA